MYIFCLFAWIYILIVQSIKIFQGYSVDEFVAIMAMLTCILHYIEKLI